MDIAGLSINLTQMNLHKDAGIALMKMAMENSQGNIDDVTDLLESTEELVSRAGDPNLGKYIDIRV
jgi:hypothetical protein